MASKCLVASLAFTAVLSTACGPNSSNSSSSAPSCAEAVGNLYGHGCTANWNGSPIDEDTLITDCIQTGTQISSGACSCGSEYDAVLNCWNNLTVCGTCSSQLEAWNNCSPSGSACYSSTTIITQSDLVGTWLVNFQKNGYSPGVLWLEIASDFTYQIPATAGISAESGTVSVTITGSQLVLTFSSGTVWDATATSSSAMSGTFSGNGSGTFSACKGTLGSTTCS